MYYTELTLGLFLPDSVQQHDEGNCFDICFRREHNLDVEISVSGYTPAMRKTFDDVSNLSKTCTSLDSCDFNTVSDRRCLSILLPF